MIALHGCPACRDLVETLREEITQLKGALRGDGWQAPHAWRLSATQERMMGGLVARERVSRGQLMIACEVASAADGGCYALISAHICHLRAKLRPFGWRIVTVWGRGYALPPDQRAAIAAGAVRAA